MLQEQRTASRVQGANADSSKSLRSKYSSRFSPLNAPKFSRCRSPQFQASGARSSGECRGQSSQKRGAVPRKNDSTSLAIALYFERRRSASRARLKSSTRSSELVRADFILDVFTGLPRFETQLRLLGLSLEYRQLTPHERAEAGKRTTFRLSGRRLSSGQRGCGRPPSCSEPVLGRHARGMRQRVLRF